MSATQLFASDPVDFCSKNIVRVSVGGTAVKGNTGQFKLRELSQTGRLPNGSSCKVYQIEQSTESDKFQAYWCPYGGDSVHSVTLASEADLMLTAKMDGCSFGVGQPGNDGTVRVAHANVQESEKLNQIAEAMFQAFDPKGQTPEMIGLGYQKNMVKQQEQWDQLNSSDGVNGQLSTEITPALYRGLTVTTFGVRSSTGKWSFHFHAFNDGVEPKLAGCFPFPNSR